MSTALIGYTGFVGSTLHRQTSFTDLFNSANIRDICDRSYDLIVCAGAPAAKWIANSEPEKDLANLQFLMDNLATVSTDKFVLISTIDVYKMPPSVDEDTIIDPGALDYYGRHRFFLEEFVRQNFSNLSIIRLPGLFGMGLKKNFIFDLMNSGKSEWTHCESVFQFYDMQILWSDVQKVIELALPLVNFATEPVKARDVAIKSFGIDFTNVTQKPPVAYDMRSKLAGHFGSETAYFYSAEETYKRIRTYVLSQKGEFTR